MYIDGRSVIFAKGLILRDEESAQSHVQGLHMQTFFGGACPWQLFSVRFSVRYYNVGSSSEWASPRDQKAWFTNISGAILHPLPLHDEL